MSRFSFTKIKVKGEFVAVRAMKEGRRSVLKPGARRR
jgi:hypothetical protein